MTDKTVKTADINFSALSIQELNDVIEKATEAKKAKKAQEIEKIRAEFEGRLNQLDLSLGDIYPQQTAPKKHGKAKASATQLEEPEKGATYQNPVNTAETWVAGAKKGRAPAWVTELRGKGELHRHKVGN